MAQYAASRIRDVAESMGNQDILMVLISGGGSALLPYPVAGITLEEKLKTIKVLASSGATIHELNTVRKNLSDLKGGKLAKAASPAKVCKALNYCGTTVNGCHCCGCLPIIVIVIYPCSILYVLLAKLIIRLNNSNVCLFVKK